MYSFRNSAYSILLLFAVLLAGCGSDRNPLDYFNLDGKKSSDAKAYIQLTLNAADTRADDSAISLVNLYVFNADGNLEQIVDNVEYATDNVIELDVEPGTKAIYAITANEIFGSKISDGSTSTATTLSEFESMVFESTLSSLITTAGFVMAGKQTDVPIAVSNTEGYVPDTNKLSITLQRLVAKVTVDASNLEVGSSLFTIGTDIGFKVFQTNNEMILSQNGYIHSSFDEISSTDGTYETYTFDNKDIDYSDASVSSSSTPQYQYMPENIVANPVTGNTTFVSVKVPIRPKTVFYDYNNVPTMTTYDNKSDFYVYGVVKEDDPYTIVDFYRYYMDYIGYYYESALSCLSVMNSSPGDGLKYVLLKYVGGCAYYRVNIKDKNDSKYQVCRNTLYTISLQTLSSMGAPSEEYLRPSDAATQLSSDEQLTYTSTSATLSVGDWTDKSDSVDL